MAFFLQYAWIIPILPLLSFAIISLTPIRKSKPASGWLAIGMMGVAIVFALGLVAGMAQGLTYLPPHEQPHAVVAADDHAVDGEHATDDEHAVDGEHATDDDHAADGEHGAHFAFPEPSVVQRIAWAPAGSASFEMGMYIDPIAAITLLMVTITSFCIHLFSMGYMAAHPRQTRFFSFISLFTAGMLGMVLADNLLLFFMSWEVMGLCSYLLIGFLFERPQAFRAGNKAFITTRIGDVLMMLGMVYIYTHAGSLAFGMREGQIFNPDFLKHLGEGYNILGMSHATTISLLLFAGTVGKSAQFPLHVWLPDAMEGPTPVSALIHAATMVSAGVFLVGRTFPIFTADDGTALLVVSFIGAFTALFAAVIAMAQFDIKRILAFSTLSQLGFMVAALGIGGWVAGMFHMLTHAFFKALLFLGSGSIIHAIEETEAIEKIHHEDEYAAQQTAQDIRNMGELKTLMPKTFWTYTMGYLALAGIIPFAGFWSKDEILADAFGYGHYIVYGVLSVAAFLTAFYMTRQWRTVFFGSYRGEKPLVFQNMEIMQAQPHHQHHSNEEHAGHGDEHGHEHGHGHGHKAPKKPHESPWTIVTPLVILAFFAVTAGFANLPFGIPGGHWLSHFLDQHAAEFNVMVAGLSLLIALAGIAIGWFTYSNAFTTAQDTDPLQKRLPGFAILNNKFYIDEMYALTIRALTYALAFAWSWIDRNILDRIINGVGKLTLFISRVNFIVDDTVLNDGPDSVGSGTITTGKGVRQVQTGQAQDYVAFIFVGVVIIALIYLYK
jgi:NADH-quinone oxidoreductase subunit L